MTRRVSDRLIIGACLLAAVGALGWLLFHDPVSDLPASVPGMDNRKKGAAIAAVPVKIGALFEAFGTAPDVPGTRWPRFRGVDFDNISKERTPLASTFGGHPKILWTKPLGEGHAAPAVYDGKVYLLDYDEKSRADLLRCFVLTTGTELWRRGYNVRLKRNHGLSRTVPAVNDRYVVTIGPKCQVMCVNRADGAFLWGVDIPVEYKSEVPFWYTGQCPLLEGDTAVFAPGGTALAVGIDCKTGKKIWETPNPKGWKMSHASLMPMTVDGKRMYVYQSIGGLCGISAEGADRGKLLWQTTAFAPSVVAPSPVVMDQGRILVCAGYGAGSALFRVKRSSDGFTVGLVDQYKPDEGIASEQQTPVYYDGHLYGIQPKDAGALRNQFICCDPENCRQVLSGSGKGNRFGLGPYLLADGKFFILNDDGILTIAEASPSSFRVLDKARIIDGQDSWGPMALTGGYLLMRDTRTLACINLKSN